MRRFRVQSSLAITESAISLQLRKPVVPAEESPEPVPAAKSSAGVRELVAARTSVTRAAPGAIPSAGTTVRKRYSPDDASEKESGVHYGRPRNRNRLYAFSLFAFFTTFVTYQTIPDEETYARQQYRENFDDARLRWCFILVGTGFASLFSKSDTYFRTMSAFIEHYMEFNYDAVFHGNCNLEGKKRVFFRGETRKEANALFNRDQHRVALPWSLSEGKFSLPYVKDATLHKTQNLPNGFTKSLVSMSSNADTTGIYGNGEAMLLVVPMTQRIASVAPHVLKHEQNNQFEHVCAGIHSREVLGVAYRDPHTLEFSAFKVNPFFCGNIDDLELDKQMLPIIALLPDGDERKKQLYRCIVPGLDYEDAYDAHLAEDETHHKEISDFRRMHVAFHGFKGSETLQVMYRFFKGIDPQIERPKEEVHFDFQMSNAKRNRFSRKLTETDQGFSL